VTFIEPRIHPFVYDPNTGECSRLDVDFSKEIQKLKDVYDLYRAKPK
jgi:hypothetical protein